MQATFSLTEVQRIPTSGARAVAPSTVGGVELLAIPQLALDIAGQAPQLNAGNSDTDLLLLRRSAGRFVPWATPADPQPLLFSQTYECDGAACASSPSSGRPGRRRGPGGGLAPGGRVGGGPTCGGIDAAVLDGGDEMQLAVSNSLDANARFAGETVLYALSTNPV